MSAALFEPAKLTTARATGTAQLVEKKIFTATNTPVSILALTHSSEQPSSELSAERWTGRDCCRINEEFKRRQGLGIRSNAIFPMRHVSFR
jgi:hypothetical protein